MNILFFTQLFYPSLFGGGEYIFFLLARELAKRGHNIHVIAQRLNQTSPFEVFEGINIYRVGKEMKYSGILPPTIKNNIQYMVNAIVEGRKVVKDCSRQKQSIDIIHSNTYVPAISGQLCSSLGRIPHIITFHDVYQASDKKFWNHWTAHQKEPYPWYTSFISKMVERAIMKFNVSAFHTVSEMSKNDLVSFGVKVGKIRVIPNGIDLRDYESAHDTTNDATVQEDEPMAVFVGRLVFYKNVESVIKAFKKVSEAIPNAKLIIIGDGPHRDILVNEARILNDHVIFTGPVSHTQKLKFLRQSSFVVFPSLLEGFGIVTIEAFACKKPVLVSDVRPLTDIVKDDYTGFVIPPFDIDMWAEKMIQLFSDNVKRNSMGEAAYREFLSQYDIGSVASNLEALYREVRVDRRAGDT